MHGRHGTRGGHGGRACSDVECRRERSTERSASSAALSAAAASTAGNAERSYFCYGYSADQKTQYLTPLAPVPASVPGTDAANYVGNVVSSAWRAYVHGELGQGPTAYAMCNGGDQTAQVQAFREQVIRTGPSGSAVRKEIDWHYTGAPASGSAAPHGSASASDPSATEAEKAKELAEQARLKAQNSEKELRKIFEH